MKRYYFICNGKRLAPVVAKSLEEAQKQLVLVHAWIGATKENSALLNVEDIIPGARSFGPGTLHRAL